MALNNHLAPSPKAWLAISMSWAAGFVDAAGWLVVYHVYTSHMTGNTATFARDVADSKWVEAFEHSWVIVPFILGLLYSALTTKAARRRGIHSSFAIALFTELVLLGIAVAIGSPGYALLSLLAAAMGIQTVTVTRINGLRVFTTYLTGSLAKFAEAWTDYFFWFHDRTRGRFWNRVGKVLRVSPRQRCLQHAALTGGLWIGFFAGALCGALSEARFAMWALAAPFAVLSVAAAIDLRWPVAAADEAVETWSAH